MKLTYNNGETIVTVEGTQDEVIDWYKTFVHSQTGWEQNTDASFVELINSKTYEEEDNKVKRIVNDTRAGEPDEDGWMSWTATEDDSLPFGLQGNERVDYVAHYSDGTCVSVRVITWSNIGNSIVKFRISK